ncbi:MAG: hypothetical protein HKN48_13600 [Flavobacteriaceae bacterium]|nr:hypothetical protein [Flavobacteriaceae bacterium]
MTKKIDLLNLVLIALSLFIAVIIPFKLFLFSYAILGPLHYLTEINWLKDKNYFLSANSKWIKVFLAIAIIISIYPLYKLSESGWGKMVDDFMDIMKGEGKILILTAFFFSVALFLFKKLSHLLLSLVACFLIAILLKNFLPSWFLIFGLFLPTIIHVYLFTGLFMLYGARKSKSRFGLLSVVVLLLVPFVIAFIPIEPVNYVVTEKVGMTYNASKFLNLNLAMTDMLNGFVDGKFMVLSPVGIKVQIFIAFAYTYHYLNWFSKTSIIGWKQSLTTRKTLYIALIWVGAIVLYLSDYFTGFVALYFLSMLHVFFEFPLNVITIKGLFRPL